MPIKTINVHCSKCDARPGRPCTTLSRSHTERVKLAKQAQANMNKALSACRTMKSLTPTPQPE